MKPSLLLALFFVAILSACAGGNPTPTAPSQQPNQTQTTPSVQQSNLPTVTLTVSANPAVANEATTFTASASSSVSATLDFGDGTRVDFAPGDSATLKHVYTRAGNFIVKVSVTDAAGNTVSASTALIVR
jgi:PKD domain